ncbi:MAG: hypothetical protein EOP38_30860, partial [Rubrivivax sp.]
IKPATVTVAFNKAIDTTGAPRLTIDVGGTPKILSLATPGAKTNVTSLAFTYTVAAGDLDTNGLSFAANPLALNGGSITLTGTSTAALLSFEAQTSMANTMVDGVAPSAPTITRVVDDVGVATGNIATGGSTDDTQPTVRVGLTGTNAVVGDKVDVLIGPAVLGTVTLVAQDITNGYVDFTPAVASALVNGTYALAARVVDAAGNQSSASATHTITVNTAAPAAPVISLVAGNDIINAAEATSDISGTAEANATIALTLGANVRTATADAQGAWSYTLTTADITSMGQGAETIRATQTNTAGNTSVARTRDITIDTVVPSAPVINAVAGDNIINASEAGGTISGTAEANASIALTLGTGNVRNVTANASGAWTYTLVTADIDSIGQGSGKTISATQT